MSYLELCRLFYKYVAIFRKYCIEVWFADISGREDGWRDPTTFKVSRLRRLARPAVTSTLRARTADTTAPRGVVTSLQLGRLIWLEAFRLSASVFCQF